MKHYHNTYREILLKKIETLNEPVFERQDLMCDRDNKMQLKLNRALKAFINEGVIPKISHGLYAKAMSLDFAYGKTQVVLQDSFEAVAMAALNKRGIKWELGSAIQAYNRGDSTQVPAVFSIKLLKWLIYVRQQPLLYLFEVDGLSKVLKCGIFVLGLADYSAYKLSSFVVI